MNAFILVGPSGSGKSEILKNLAFPIKKLPENYMELNKHNLDNTLILSKWYYSGDWFNRVLDNKKLGEVKILTDRCPLETAAYAKFGKFLFKPLQISFSELNSLGVNTIFIYIKCDFNTLMDRIEARIAEQPERIKYHELNIKHNKKAFNFYEKNRLLWNYTIENNNNLQDSLQSLVSILEQ